MNYKHWLCGLALTLAASTVFAGRNDLRIDYINVGQGGSTFITGPNGVKILYDFGRVAGKLHIVPYLKEQLNLKPGDGIDYAILSHADKDHYTGYLDVVAKNSGDFNILKANFEPGTPKTKSHSLTLEKYLLEPAKPTAAGPFQPIPLGYRIDLGDGALAIAVAANGKVLGETAPDSTTLPTGGEVSRMNENDRSIALFIKYKKFQYIIDGDLGSGPETCSDHQTDQRDIQTKVAQALIDLGWMNKELGVDVLHIAHHGSESSTSWKYYQLMKPEVGVISAGPDQGHFLHPRADVVEKVLTCRTIDTKDIGPDNTEDSKQPEPTYIRNACKRKPDGDTRADCPTPAGESRAEPLQGLYQTDIGAWDESSTGKTSFQGFVAGDIIIRTDGETNYSVSWTGRRIPWKNPPGLKNIVIKPGMETYTFDEDTRKQPR